MASRNLFIAALLFIITTNVFSQNKEQIISSTESVSKFHLQTDNIQDLKDFDWSTLKELFKGNEPNKIVKLVFQYENESKKRNSKPNIKNLKFEMSGTTAELPDLLEKAQKMVDNFIAIDDKYN